MIVVIIIVCCVLLIKKKVDAPNVTASVSMNGTTRDLSGCDVINKAPTFKLSDSENSKKSTKCHVESKATCGEDGEWEKGLNSSTGDNLSGDCTFEFRRVCKRSVSETTAFSLTIDRGLPDIGLTDTSELTANKWFGVSFNTQDESETSGFDWGVERVKPEMKENSAEKSDEPIKIDKVKQRFTVGGSGDFVITVTTTNNHSNILEISVNAATLVKST